ncbi:sensor histidine kinase [Falsigemmobacter faecalis]|uniref:histidine kinase n=1 Tax=Falsigemmobacter faecalis TaxID=2488730 RepID=A0A3P3DRU9_9RHOB|nr:sensor histidine kinase [Falsigemmobacter faecalis]RRH76967.1 HAMP domain-containing protein [Falsigemmobacter faecalis]
MSAASPHLSDRPLQPSRPNEGSVVLGEDWVSPAGTADADLRDRRRRRGMLSLNRSPLARKIVIFNLLALVIMVAGVLFLHPFRTSLLVQREAALVTETRLIASLLELQGEKGTVQAAQLADLPRSPRTELRLYDPSGRAILNAPASDDPAEAGRLLPAENTFLSDLLSSVWQLVADMIPGGALPREAAVRADVAAGLVAQVLSNGQAASVRSQDERGETLFSVAAPLRQGDRLSGIVVALTEGGALDRLVRNEREQILRMFAIALVVSVALSLVLASTIANPLADLAAAAELGRDRNARKLAPGRVRIPDLTARPDEIGRLSGALRGMVAALYDRIDANEQFAADVAHEIKNPLASLRSAVGSLRLVSKPEHRDRLLDVIDHDVRRLDRLVSDISNASRLDSELVKEEEEEFNLLRTLKNINEFLGQQAEEKGVDFITDLPSDPILIHGLEGRLAQVFVNLIGNAISFCEDGDAVRVWLRKRDNRVLVVVEDTGPGIPEEALSKIFNRFYSERPEGQFGEHSGLGLAISKQIIEAHGGVIWAENIRPTEDDITSPPLGARFVVGLRV